MNAYPRIEVAQIVTRFIAGAGGVALRGALSLDPSRFHVTVITGEGDDLLDAARAAGMDVIVEPTLVSPVSPRHDREALKSLTAVCHDSGFDVVHTHSAKAGALGRVAAHRTGVPLTVHTYHGFPFHRFQSPWRRAAYIAIEQRLATITDVVLAIGSGVATEALRLRLADPTTLRTVTPAVDGTTVLADAASRRYARALVGVPEEAPVIGTVGRLDYQKAPEQMVAAVEMMRHKDAVLVWVGGGPDEQAVRRLVAARGLQERFLLLGQRSDVASILPAFDVFAMTSRYEGLPCAVVEAMRCGLPVVATAVNSVPDLVVPGETGILVPPGHPGMVAAAADRLLDDPATAARMAMAGRRLAGSHYDAARLGEILDEVYTGGLARSRTLSMAG